MIREILSYWFKNSSTDIEDIHNFLHEIDDNEAEEIILWKNTKKIVILQEKENNKIQLTYLHANEIQKKIITVPSNTTGNILEDSTNKKYSSIQDAIQQNVSIDAIAFKNFDYAQSTLNDAQNNNSSLSNLVIEEILDISAAYAIAVFDQSASAEILRAECLFYQFKQQLLEIENLELNAFHQIVLPFQTILEDKWETDTIRSKCYFSLAKLAQELRDRSNDKNSSFTLFTWYALYLAKQSTPYSSNELQSITDEYIRVTNELVGEDLSEKTLSTLHSLPGYKEFSKKICHFLFQKFIAHWKTESSEIDEVYNIIKIITQLVDHAPLFKEFNFISNSETLILKQLILKSANFTTTNQLLNWIEINLRNSSMNGLTFDCLSFIKKNSIFLRREMIINFTEYDNTGLMNKKRQRYYSLLFSPPSHVDNPKLNKIIIEFKPQKLTIDAHGDGKMIELKNHIKKSPEEMAKYLAFHLNGVDLSKDLLTINLISCFGAGSFEQNIRPEQSFAYKLCRELAELKIIASIVARIEIVSVTISNGIKQVNGEHHKENSKFKFEFDGKTVQISCFNYTNNSWKQYTTDMFDNKISNNSASNQGSTIERRMRSIF